MLKALMTTTYGSGCYKQLILWKKITFKPNVCTKQPVEWILISCFYVFKQSLSLLKGHSAPLCVAFKGKQSVKIYYFNFILTYYLISVV